MSTPPEGYKFTDAPTIHAGNGRYLMWHPKEGFEEGNDLPEGWRWLAFDDRLQPRLRALP